MAIPVKALLPVARKLAVQLGVIIANSPEVQKRLVDVGNRIREVQKARTPEAKIAKSMVAVREQAEAVLDAVGTDPASVVSVQATSWKQRADQIERAVGILQHQPRAARKSQLARIAGMADSLLEEVLTSLIDDAKSAS
jgi:hypothetical protein